MSGKLHSYADIASTVPNKPRYLPNRSSIEFLPGDGSDWLEAQSDRSNEPFILLEGHLGIPEKILYQCYVACTKAFQAIISADTEMPTRSARNSGELHMLTGITLLANPSHTTALNLRKTLVDTGFMDSRSELLFTAALLSIKQSAKVSMLWHHRRWIHSRCYSKSSFDEDFGTIPLSVADIRVEFELAKSACEIYPRNYHAWYHRFLCLQSCAFQARQSVAHAALLEEERLFVWSWLRMHVSDHSAVNYLTRLYDLLETLNTTDSMNRLRDDGKIQTLDLLHSYPSHESLWLLLRWVVGSNYRSQEAGSGLVLDLSITGTISDIHQTLIGGTGNGIDAEKTLRLIVRHRLWMEKQVSHILYTAYSALIHMFILLEPIRQNRSSLIELHRHWTLRNSCTQFWLMKSRKAIGLFLHDWRSTTKTESYRRTSHSRRAGSPRGGNSPPAFC